MPNAPAPDSRLPAPAVSAQAPALTVGFLPYAIAPCPDPQPPTPAASAPGLTTMMKIATILPRQWEQHCNFIYSVWVHRLLRAVSKEIGQMPAQPPPLPWPIRKKPISELRAYNSGLFPKFPVKPNDHKCLNTYVPKRVDLETARTEVYRPDQDKGEDWLWRIRICWDEPRPWEIEAIVDPGGALYLPFFRQVTIRLPLKAKVCRDIKARKDGQWVGQCQSVKKLNGREAIAEATKSLINNEQLIVNNGRWKEVDNGQWIMENYGQRTAGTPNAGLRPQHPAPDTQHRALRAPAAHSPGAVAYRAKVAARKREAGRAGLARRLDTEGALHVEGFYPSQERWPVRYESTFDRKRRMDRFEQEQEKERQAHRAMLEVAWSLERVDYGPNFLRRDDHDGYLVTRQEVGPDPYDYDWPKLRVRPPRRVGKRKRPSTARDRLERVKPSLRIITTGPRSAELVITRRMHEVKTGLPEALDLARMIEGAIKYRSPLKSGRKQSWRQQLRSAVLYRPGLLTWLVRNPINDGEPEAGELCGAARPGKKPPKGGTPNAGFWPQPLTPNPQSRALRAPATDFGTLPKEYLGLIDRQWLSPASNLFEAAPAGAFATTVEGYRLRLPLAVMPPAVYERWLAHGGHKRRRRKRPKGLAGGCRCFSPPGLTKMRVGRSSASARSPLQAAGRVRTVSRTLASPRNAKGAFFLRN